MTQEQIKKFIVLRKELLATNETLAADNIETEIKAAIKGTYNDYPVDFIIETLTEFGEAPNVMYDDCGRFAVSSAGYQPVPIDGPISGTFTVFVEQEQWKSTIREALWDYLTSE